MHITIHWSFIKYIPFVMLLASGPAAIAQSAADQSFKAIPTQVKESAETKATSKTNTLSSNAMNKLDSASGKVFKGFTGLFKKKGKKAAADSTRLHTTDSAKLPTADSTAVPAKSP